MTAPAAAAKYLLAALLTGAGLGIVYGFLRPLRPRLTTLADGIFVAAAFWGWIYLTFAVCGGDSRLGCTLTLAAGGIFFECTLGRLLRPVYALFWKGVGKFFRGILLPVRKILDFFQKIYNFLLAILKKWFTIVGTIIKSGGIAHGRHKQPRQAGAEKNQSRHKSRHSGRGRPVRGGAGSTLQLHRPDTQSV